MVWFVVAVAMARLPHDTSTFDFGFQVSLFVIAVLASTMHAVGCDGPRRQLKELWQACHELPSTGEK